MQKFVILTFCIFFGGCFISIDESLLHKDIGVDGPPDIAYETCVEQCIDGKIKRCNETIIECALGCDPSGDPKCKMFVPRNGVPIPSWASTEDFIPEKDVTIWTCEGKWQVEGEDKVSFPNGVFTTVTQSQKGAPKIGAFSFRKISIDKGVTVKGNGECALALVAYVDIRIQGTVDLSAQEGGDINSCAKFASGNVVKLEPGPGGGEGAIKPAVAQGPCPGGNAIGDEAHWPGGGGGANGTNGGNGGSVFVVTGGNNTLLGGQGAFSCLEESEVLFGGSGGGYGACPTDLCDSYGRGGGGGGALVFIAGNTISISGEILLKGATGDFGRSQLTEDPVGSGGGGSGGTLFIEAPNVTFLSNAKIDTTGGHGGAVCKDTIENTAAGGEAGKGKSSAVNGNDGYQAVSEGTSSGGGGGAGRIRIFAETFNGTPDPPATIFAIVSERGDLKFSMSVPLDSGVDSDFVGADSGYVEDSSLHAE